MDLAKASVPSTSAMFRQTAASPKGRLISKAVYLALYQISTVSAAPIKDYFRIALEDLPKDPKDASLWIYLAVAAVLVLLGGAFAGLTIACVCLQIKAMQKLTLVQLDGPRWRISTSHCDIW